MQSYITTSDPVLLFWAVHLTRNFIEAGILKTVFVFFDCVSTLDSHTRDASWKYGKV